MQNLVFAPASKAQEQFLNSQATITFYGGAAGAGKSHCLLGSFLKYCHHPNTRGVILRRTTKQISNPGGLFDSAINLYKQVDPKLKIKMRELEIIFSSGAKLKFGYLDNANDRYDYQGAELTFIGFDEIQQLDEENVIYLLSRLRSTNVDYQLQAYATGNPDYDAFIRPWVEYALDERGVPVRKDDYPTRYFIRVSGSSYEWSDSLEELEAKYGPAEDSGINSFKFVPGNIYDNPILIQKNPGYLAQLKALPRVEMERLLLGSWYARSEASGLFKRDWTPVVPRPNYAAKQRVRCWDLAFSKPSEVYPNPDWTRGVLISKDDSKVYTVEDMQSMRDRVHAVEKLIFDTAIRDGFGTVISIPLDPAAAAGAYAKDLQRRLSEMGFACRLTKPVKSKVTRFAPFSSIAQAGFVQITEGDWNKDFFDELEIFDGDKKKKDDIVDCCSDAMVLLNRENSLPSMLMPDFSGSTSGTIARLPQGSSLPSESMGLPFGFSSN